MTEQELANVIWDIKEIIRNLYDDAEGEDVILPFTLLRRLDCVLDDKREVIMEQIKDLPDAQKKFKLKALMRQNGLSFFNTSGLSFEKLLGAPSQIGQSFATYLELVLAKWKECQNGHSVGDFALFEKIPQKQDIDAYFEREVLPYAPDAWMDRSKDKLGVEFPFTRLFYIYRPLRSSEEILIELNLLDKELDNELKALKG